ncbi:GH25 family lysozyme [Actinoplanes oblitus]|uniref:GH25 family lysozyme n=1 Tax=Actinoplanes oblitus TaxID=3040509 RepID=A0ABY8W9S1_9ACTN|nr:GH25 family lysozyme [Actinoplanes oblitus]WIM93134.1 GH25 family lysozyme [Actinoplanes oblitus]
MVTAAATVVLAVPGGSAAHAGPPPEVPGDGGYAGAGGYRAPASSLVPPAATPPAGYPVTGIDVSSHDHPQGRMLDWRSLGRSNAFAYVKATEGAGYTNRYYRSDVSAAKSAGMYAGAYAFGRPDLGNATGQADHFVDTMEDVRDGRTLPPFLDMEWPYRRLRLPACYRLSAGTMTAWIRTFLERVESRLGVVPMIYTNVNWWNRCTNRSAAFGHYPLDISSCAASPPSVPGWGRNWTFWQYDIPDCTPGLAHDADVFRGSRTDLATLARQPRR